MILFLRTSILILISSLFLCPSSTAQLPAPFQIGTERVVKIQELPDSAYFLLEDSSYMDLGAFYKQVIVFFIPIWNYEIAWCGYVGNDQQLLTLDSASLEAVIAEAGISIAPAPSLPFWTVAEGKLLLLIIILGSFGSGYWWQKQREKSPKNLEEVIEIVSSIDTGEEEEV
ncbi:MAG: hypothetical protein AB8E82_03810 [Aureispira sp.]